MTVKELKLRLSVFNEDMPVEALFNYRYIEIESIGYTIHHGDDYDNDVTGKVYIDIGK